MFTLRYSKNAARELRKLDRQTAAMIYSWIDKNLQGCLDPRKYGKPLIGDMKGLWRYRVGSYRLIADIQDEAIVIEIINVAHRRSIYL